jgi:hypothetical protein
VILAQAEITTVPTSHIVGDIGASPESHTAITGFSLVLDSSGSFGKSHSVDGSLDSTLMNEYLDSSDLVSGIWEGLGRRLLDSYPIDTHSSHQRRQRCLREGRSRNTCGLYRAWRWSDRRIDADAWVSPPAH